MEKMLRKPSKNRKYIRYELWECWRNGMYGNQENREEILLKIIELLKNPDALYEAMKHVSIEWGNSASHNLTKNGKHYRSWLGQAACNFEIGATEDTTREAWSLLSQDERDNANMVADKVKEEWINAR